MWGPAGPALGSVFQGPPTAPCVGRGDHRDAEVPFETPPLGVPAGARVGLGDTIRDLTSSLLQDPGFTASPYPVWDIVLSCKPTRGVEPRAFSLRMKCSATELYGHHPDAVPCED